jgi:hypothetical protein
VPLAPSWSWAAWEGPVQIVKGFGRWDENIEIEKAEFINDRPAIWYASSSLRFTAHLWSAIRSTTTIVRDLDSTLGLWEEPDGFTRQWALRHKCQALLDINNFRELSGFVHFDDQSNAPETFTCVSLGSGNAFLGDRRLTYFLIAERTGIPNTFKRLGIGIKSDVVRKIFEPKYIRTEKIEKVSLAFQFSSASN